MGDSEFYLEMGFDSYLAYLNSLHPIDIEHVDINDIVWARRRNVYCPAVVTDVYEEGIIKVWFVDNPYESVEFPVTEVMAFLDLEEIRDQAIASNCVETFDEIKEIALQYMSRKAEGHQEDPLQFFLSTNSDILMKKYETNYQEALKQISSESEEDIEIAKNMMNMMLEAVEQDSKESAYFEECDIKGEVPYEAEGPDQAEKHVQAVEYDEVKHAEVEQNCEIQPVELLSDVENNEDTNLCSSYSLVSTAPAPLRMENSYAKQLVSYIKSGSVKHYLVQLLKGETSSFYYEFYKKCMKAFTRKKLTKICYGPIDDVETLKDVIPYLVTTYRSVLEQLPESVPVPECEPYFIAAVWLPESITFAISCHNYVPVYDAYKVLIQSSALRPDYLGYVEEYCMGSAVPLTKMSESLDVPFNDCSGSSTPKPSLQFSDALKIVNDVVFVDEMDCRTFFTTLEEKMQDLQEEKSKTRG